MFVRIKNSHGYKYLQIVESKREGKKVKQRVLATGYEPHSGNHLNGLLV